MAYLYVLVSCLQEGYRAEGGVATSGPAYLRPSRSLRRCRAAYPRVPPSRTFTHHTHWSWGPAVTRHTRTFTRLPSHDPPTTVTKHPLSHPVTLCTTRLGNLIRHQREKVPMARRTYVLLDADAVSRRGRIVVIELPLCWESANVTHSTTYYQIEITRRR